MIARIRKAFSHLILAGVAFLALAVPGGARADDATCTNPIARPLGTGAAQVSLTDNPAARAGWFLNGRKPSGLGLAGGGSPAPPARKLLQSFQQFNQMPRRPGLAAAPPSWRSLGPAPQRSLYWGNVSGRVTSLAVDGRDQKHVLYVGTAFGGLWKTDDFSAPSPHFLPLGDRIWPSLAVGSIALDTNRPTGQSPIIYVGTGEANDSLDSYYGVGILKSSDGGNSWSISTGAGGLVALSSSAQYDLDGPFVGAAVSRILVDPSRANHILAAVSRSYLSAGKSPKTAIYESPDAGDSWQPMTLVGGAAGAAYNTTDLVYEPVQAAFYATVQGLGVYRLAAGQSEWKPTASPFGGTSVNDKNFYRASLATRASGGRGNVYMLISAGDFGGNDPRNYSLSRPTARDTGIVHSSDGGSIWEPVPAPTELFGDGQGFYDQWITAPAEAESIMVGGIDIWRTASSSASSWANASRAYDWSDGLVHPNLHIHPDQHAIVVLDDTHWIVGNDGGVWRTENGGTTWIDLNTDVSSIQFMSVTPLSSPVQGYLGGSQDNGTALTGVAGQPWTTTLTGDGGFTSGNPSEPAQYFTERFYVSLCRSDDFGKGWKTVVDGDKINERAPFYVPYQLLRAGQDEILLGAKRVWLGPALPTSAGAGWRSISSPLSPTPNGFVQAIASAPSSPQTVYVTTSDSLIFVNPDVHARNAALKWSAIKKNNLPNDRAYAAVAVDPKDAKVAYLAVQGFGPGHLFRTDNSGGKWRDVTPSVVMKGQRTQIDTPINSILIDLAFPSDVYIATDIGVFVTSDRGATWQPHGADLPRTAVMDLKMTSDRKILAATHGRGAWTIEPLPHEKGGAVR